MTSSESKVHYQKVFVQSSKTRADAKSIVDQDASWALLYLSILRSLPFSPRLERSIQLSRSSYNFWVPLCTQLSRSSHSSSFCIGHTILYIAIESVVALLPKVHIPPTSRDRCGTTVVRLKEVTTS